MNDKLRSTLEKIEALAKQNPEFALELQKIAKSSSPANSASIPNGVTEDISAIREALSIRADKSISYDFVSYQRIRDQLIIDNLRMENARLDLKLSDDRDRYMSFCVNAFYQVESIINYYFYKSYSDNVQEVVRIIENATAGESSYYQYKSKGGERNIGDIPISSKINAFYNIVLPSEIKQDKVFMGKLRVVRNDYSHRGGSGEKVENSNASFDEFYKRYTFDSIRGSLKKLVQAVKDSIQKDIVEVDAVVTAVLPSACYVQYGDKNEMLPNNIYLKCKNLEQGNRVKLTIIGGRIVNIVYVAQNSASIGILTL